MVLALLSRNYDGNNRKKYVKWFNAASILTVSRCSVNSIICAKIRETLNFKGRQISMATVNSNLPTNLFISAPTLPIVVTEGPKFDLNPGQMIRATVVEGGMGQAILEINRQNYLAQGERELRVGQTLNLQVVQTQPRLEFKVVSDSLNDRLAQALPLLTRSFDWGQLVSQLRQHPGQQALPSATVAIYNQLQQILNSAAEGSTDFKENMTLIVAQLRQLLVSEGPIPGNNIGLPRQTLQQPMLQNSQQIASLELSPMLTQLIKNLQSQLSLLPKQAGVSLSKGWYLETRSLLTPLHQGRALPLLSASQRQPLVTVLKQLQQHSKVSPQLSGEVKRILIQIDRSILQDTSQPVIRSNSAITKDPVIVPKFPVSNTSEQVTGREALSQLSADIKQLLDRVQQGQANKQGIVPDLLGRLEGLLGRLQHLPQVVGDAPVSIPGFEMIVGQLEQLVTQRPTSPQGGQLGVLSQLFGFYLEAELLQGKRKDALNSLKLSLLNLQKELGDEVKEPLRKIELFQLCKAKLAEEQVQFLPLPFNELDEGYLLAEKRPQATDDAENKPPLQMSLSLRLSALGNIRIDMLYEKEGLHLRLACEDQGKMRYLQNCTDELKESLQAIELQGISFSADAQLPARQLQERLLPDSVNMLDARI